MISLDNYKYSETTKNIIYAFNRVHKVFGYGFPKNVYENALFNEFSRMDLLVEKHIKVFYKDQLTETFLADFMIENTILIELKTSISIPDENEFEFNKYLNASEIEVALLLNFGIKPEFDYKVFSNHKNLNLQSANLQL